jgi:hypothetical protein
VTIIRKQRLAEEYQQEKGQCKQEYSFHFSKPSDRYVRPHDNQGS